MFEGRGILSLNNDFLELSYADSATWPNFTSSGSIRSHAFDFGDSEVGPRVHLSIVEPVEGEVLDWQHSIDPAHYHGTDQFRVILSGAWIVANRAMPKRSYLFQESGIPYREHPVDGAPAWFMLLTADRRGAAATLMLQSDKETLFKGGENYGEPVPEDSEYPHPSGSKGVAAIATTAGDCQRGYLGGMIADLHARKSIPGTISGVAGDTEKGPLIHVLNVAPNKNILPKANFPVETMLLIVSGSCHVGDREYNTGDVRMQAANTKCDAVRSGSEGLEAIFIISDRRAVRDLNNQSEMLPDWVMSGADLVQTIER